MNSYIFESIEQNEKYFAKCFIASIDHSNFHWHYEYELVLVIKGRVLIKISPDPVVLEAKDMLFINSKSVHEISNMEEENLCLFIQIEKRIFNEFKDDNKMYNFYFNSKLQEIPLKREYDYFVKLVSKIGLEALRTDMGGYYRSKSLLYMLIADLFEYVPYDVRQRGSSHVENTELLMEIIEYVSKNYKEDKVLEDLYRDLGISEKTTYRFLKSHIGLSPKELLDINRIDEAKKMLKYTDKSIQYISDNCGFQCENTFYRVFKKIMGVTPNTYRNNGAKDNKVPEIQGYLNFNTSEAINILKGFINEGC